MESNSKQVTLISATAFNGFKVYSFLRGNGSETRWSTVNKSQAIAYAQSKGWIVDDRSEKEG